MRRITLFAGFMLTLCAHGFAQADARLDGLKKMNADGCVQAIQFEEHAPKDSKQVKPYCTCVYEVYYNGFTPAEQKQVLESVLPPGKFEASLPARLQAAQAQCRKKIGF